MKSLAILSDKENPIFIDLAKRMGIDYDIIDKENINSITPDRYSSLAILADWYPDLPDRRTKEIIQRKINEFKNKGRKVFCEFFPLKGIFIEKVLKNRFGRLIRVGDIIKDSGLMKNLIEDKLQPPRYELLEPHQCYYLRKRENLKVESVKFYGKINPEGNKEPEIMDSLYILGKVVGVYHAVYGPPKDFSPGIGRFGDIIFSSLAISDFDLREYRLQVKWERLLYEILLFLVVNRHKDGSIGTIPAFTSIAKYDNRKYIDRIKNSDGKNRTEQYIQTIKKGLEWYWKSGVLKGQFGDRGVFEGFSSEFGLRGEKYLRKNDILGNFCRRADCTADSAIPFILTEKLPDDPQSMQISAQQREIFKRIGKNLINNLFSEWQHYPDPTGLHRGFFGWFNDYYSMYVFYSDDNGRTALESLLYGIVFGNVEAIRRGIAAAIALYKTTGKNGHRYSRINLGDFYIRTFTLRRRGRRWFRNHNTLRVEYRSPHYEGWTHAAILYAALLLRGDKMEKLRSEMIEKIGAALEDYMEKFPDVPLEHSVGDDFSKLLIACVLLHQNLKTEKTKQYVEKILRFFKKIQDPISGAIKETDPLGHHKRKEKSNSKYGTGEAALYTDDSDTISDQLYSGGFITMGLYLAYKTGDFPESLPMLKKLLDYFSAIQIKSHNPQLDGTWTRGFDYYYGEPYGSNGDVGWGAYSIETGWCVGPILTSFLFYLTEIDPFPSERWDLYNKVAEIFADEWKIQTDLEKDWIKNTPPPPKPYRRLTEGEKRAMRELAEKNDPEWNDWNPKWGNPKDDA